MRTTQRERRLTSQEVNEMCELYVKGWKLTYLGKKFKIDHTSVMYHVKKRKLTQKKIIKKYPLDIQQHECSKNNKNKVNYQKQYNDDMTHKVIFTYEELIENSRKRDISTLHDKECPHNFWIKRCSLCKAILESDSQCNVNTFGYTKDIFNEFDKLVCSYKTSERLHKIKIKQNTVLYWVYFKSLNVVSLKTKLNLPDKNDKDTIVYAAYSVQELYSIIQSLHKSILTDSFLLNIAKHSQDPNYIARVLINATKLNKL